MKYVGRRKPAGSKYDEIRIKRAVEKSATDQQVGAMKYGCAYKKKRKR
jgi:hypothetical protein